MLMEYPIDGHFWPRLGINGELQNVRMMSEWVVADQKHIYGESGFSSHILNCPLNLALGRVSILGHLVQLCLWGNIALSRRLGEEGVNLYFDELIDKDRCL